MSGAGDDFAAALAAADEPAPGPRPARWDGDARLASMREDLATLRADRAARHAVHAGQRKAARDLYERTRREAGAASPRTVLPWLADNPPPCWVW